MATALDLLAQRKQQLEADVDKLEKTVRVERGTYIGRAGKPLTPGDYADIQPRDGVPRSGLFGMRDCAKGARLVSQRCCNYCRCALQNEIAPLHAQHHTPAWVCCWHTSQIQVRAKSGGFLWLAA